MSEETSGGGRLASVAVIVTTVATADDAQRLSDALLDERLAACVTALPGARSTYRYRGAVERVEEIVLLVKTAPALLEAAAERVRALHPYELPEILAFDHVPAASAYAAWVSEETA